MGILVSSLGFFHFGRRVFLQLKAAEEERLAVMAALERIRLDVGRAGQGLVDPVKWGLLPGLEVSESSTLVEWRERSLVPTEGIPAGASRIACEGTDDLAANRMVCLFDDEKGEVGTIAESGRDFIILSTPVRYAYDLAGCQLGVVASVKYFLQNGTLRRQANGSSAQPLLEDVEEWEVKPGTSPALVSFRLRLKGKERTHAISVLSKNIILAREGG
jgi:hypothetical protein